MECKAETNKKDCACEEVECERRGICCECLRYHLTRRSLPICMRKLSWLKAST